MNDPSTQSLPDDFGRAFINGVGEALLSGADALGDLDRRAGDGDFGTNITTAMKFATSNIEDDDPATYREWVTAMYMAWLGVGGTSGPLFGMFFRDLAKAGEDPEATGSSDATGDDVPTLAQFAEALAAGQATVQKYGEAKVGDKTLVDALDPAVTALRDAAGVGAGAGAGADADTDPRKSPSDALADAEQAAIDAAKNTAESVARRGRASYVGDAAKGVIDPGAAAIALIIGAARAAVSGEKGVDTSWIS